MKLYISFSNASHFLVSGSFVALQDFARSRYVKASALATLRQPCFRSDQGTMDTFSQGQSREGRVSTEHLYNVLDSFLTSRIILLALMLSTEEGIVLEVQQRKPRTFNISTVQFITNIAVSCTWHQACCGSIAVDMVICENPAVMLKDTRSCQYVSTCFEQIKASDIAPVRPTLCRLYQCNNYLCLGSWLGARLILLPSIDFD